MVLCLLKRSSGRPGMANPFIVSLISTVDAIAAKPSQARGFGAGGTRGARLRCQCDADAEDESVCYAARRSYRWCKPPTCGIATISPSPGGATAREIGASLASDRCVRDFR
jgi:hypothetical protein